MRQSCSLILPQPQPRHRQCPILFQYLLASSDSLSPSPFVFWTRFLLEDCRGVLRYIHQPIDSRTISRYCLISPPSTQPPWPPLHFPSVSLPSAGFPHSSSGSLRPAPFLPSRIHEPTLCPSSHPRSPSQFPREMQSRDSYRLCKGHLRVRWRALSEYIRCWKGGLLGLWP